VNMCIFIRGFWVSIRVLGIRSGFGYSRVWFWWWISTRIGVRFGFGFRFRVSIFGARRLHPIRTRPVAILSHYNICNIQIKYLQHTSETDEIFWTNSCNIPLKHLQHVQHLWSTCNIHMKQLQRTSELAVFVGFDWAWFDRTLFQLNQIFQVPY
jgi:hypothetical protein